MRRIPQADGVRPEQPRRRCEGAAEIERLARDRAEAARPRPKIEKLREQARRRPQPPMLKPAQRDPDAAVHQREHAGHPQLHRHRPPASTSSTSATSRPATFTHPARGRDARAGAEPDHVGQPALVQGGERAHHPGDRRHDAEAPAVRGAGDPHLLHLACRPAGNRCRCSNTITRVPGMAITPTIAVNKTGQHHHRPGDRGVAEIIERIIEANDKPRAEVIVDVEILEVNRDAGEAVRAEPVAVRDRRASSRPRCRPGRQRRRRQHGGGSGSAAASGRRRST